MNHLFLEGMQTEIGPGLIIFICILFNVLLITTISLAIYAKRKKLDYEEKEKQVKELKDVLEEEIGNKKKLNENLETLSRQKTDAQIQLQNTQSDLVKLMAEKSSLEMELKNAEMHQVKQDNIDNLDDLTADRNFTLAKLEEQCQEKIAAIKDLEAQLKALEEKIEEKTKEKNVLDQKLNGMKTDLDSLKESYRSALNVTERRNERFELKLIAGSKEDRLIKAIDEISMSYPELRTDLNRICWNKVWLPQIQQICLREGLDKVGGIYKLTWKEDESICYIGQAVNIKERWYTHIKKMVGVEPKGNERLYEEGRTPDKFYWEVVEVIEDAATNKAKMDERERYYIELLGCKEIGLNKK